MRSETKSHPDATRILNLLRIRSLIVERGQFSGYPYSALRGGYLESKITPFEVNQMSNRKSDVLEAVRALKQYKDGLRISKIIHKNIELIGRKSKDTLQKWHQLGAIVQGIKKKIGNSYGKNLVAVLAKEYGHDEADLHRAAKFARLAPDYQAFKKQNPDVSDLRNAVRSSTGESNNRSKERRAAKSPLAKVVAKQLDRIEEVVGKLIQAYRALRSREEDTTEVTERLRRIRDTIESAFEERVVSEDATNAMDMSTEPNDHLDPTEVVPYKECGSVETKVVGNLEDIPVEDIAAIMKQVIRVEGPIHIDDLAERVRTLTKQKRVGKDFRKKIDDALKMAEWEEEAVTRSGDFFWPSSEEKHPRIRMQKNARHRNLTRICGEELRLAADRARKENGASDIATVARKTLTLLGFERPRNAACDRVMSLLTKPAQGPRKV